MRVFLSSYRRESSPYAPGFNYSGFSLAIPMDFVSSIFIFTGIAKKKIEYNEENRNTYISLPLLFNCPQEDTRHGIVLKDESCGGAEGKIILLSTEVESEKEIPYELFFPIPKTLCVSQFSLFFSGIFFHSPAQEKTLSELSAGTPGLLLNPQHLAQNIKKELNHD